MDEQDNAVKIAVVEEQIKGLREQQSAHNSTTQNRFNVIEAKLDELFAVMNRGRGAYIASVAIAGAIGAFVLSVISSIADYFHR
jgi:hypothetical protein